MSGTGSDGDVAGVTATSEGRRTPDGVAAAGAARVICSDSVSEVGSSAESTNLVGTGASGGIAGVTGAAAGRGNPLGAVDTGAGRVVGSRSCSED